MSNKKLNIVNKDCEWEKFTHEEHVLKLPDTYIGSIEKTTENLWVYNEELNKMEKKMITYIPGQYKIFDEIIVNAVDHSTRIKERVNSDLSLNLVKTIKVDINEETGEISVFNDGEGITIEKHPKEKIYIPELIFGNLLTSSNYKKDQIKHIGGKNGYGAKLANIFSTQFIVETIDSKNQKKFIQTFKNNMTVKEKPTITKSFKKPYTKISYIPDFKRFNETKLSKDMILRMKTRVYDVAANTDSDVIVYLNGTKLIHKNFEKYMDIYLGPKKDLPRAYELVNDRWEVGATLNPNLSFEQISFVNGISTTQGGKHVDYVTNQITKKLAEYINKKKKIVVKTNYIKENLIVFVKCVIDNPAFNSQLKEMMTTSSSNFGSKCNISDKFIDKLAKCGIMEKAIALTNFKENKDLKKTDGKKQNIIRGIPKLDDANLAGTKRSNECTLILTEGDSAKATAMAGLSIIGRDKYGVFPLKGKLLNVKGDDKNMTKKILENDEINNLKKIMGLQIERKYDNLNELRYGRICIFTDQDEDGSHIKGLVMNLFHTLWNSLFIKTNFLVTILTPVIKAKKGKQTVPFYCVNDYTKWKENNNGGKGWKIKYYKGLGTSTKEEARDYFKKLKMVTYTTNQENDHKQMNLAFGQLDGSSDLRKEWLSVYNPELTLDYNSKNVSVSDFINRDLIHFSNSDNNRSIANIMDGLKPSQRKILFCCFKRNLKDSIRVAQLAGYVSEHGAYHHGEASLNSTIVNMAQDFVGSNNINLLTPDGQFGSRLMGGKDAAQPRYIHTKLENVTYKLFNQHDNNVISYNDDDGMKIEPHYYVPILPLILINGCSGIGTGWSTNIPCYNPQDIIKNIKNLLDDKPYLDMMPWYKGFKGTIEKINDHSYITKGTFNVKKPDVLEITELPIGTWTEKYKEILESLIIDVSSKSKKKQYIRNYYSYCTDTDIKFEIYFAKNTLNQLLTEQIEHNGIMFSKLEKVFKLTSMLNTNNMVLFDHNRKIKKYNSVKDILDEYMLVRDKFYKDRRTDLLDNMNREMSLLEVKVKFILDFINNKIIINNRSKSDIIQQLLDNDYPKLNKIYPGSEEDYQYLLKMPIYNLTKDKIDEFTKDLANRKNDIDILVNKTNKIMWNEDLSKLDLIKPKKLKIKNA